MTGSGFRVDTGRLRGAATGFRASGDSVGTAVSAISAAKVPTAAFGISGPGPELAADIEKAVGHRLERLRTRHARRGEFAGKLDVAAADYDRAESETQEDLRAAGRQQ
ncbi:type VII secretion target [Amycolatopsis albispora]|uniref:ESX-1 secretion-associated protein n=1 Tax=Amycolatopsis albispora TaxID=1804986 RepID=A0A344LF23_9PSEU|nr:type VII secretion target [Amycolatopsis albispora]AXB46647.1 hypothetical protein A4R43_32895 [Amycolatopsis albispora]